MSFNFQSWYDSINQGNVLFSYQGTISTELITEVLDQVEEKLLNSQVPSKIRKRVYNILVEALQNLYHHIDDWPGENGQPRHRNFAVFTIAEKEGKFEIATGNFIKTDKKQFLIDRLDQINYLAKDELKALYKLILNNQEFSNKGGGGLGMIDIARRTGKKLQYEFFSYNPDYSFFSLRIKI